MSQKPPEIRSLSAQVPTEVRLAFEQVRAFFRELNKSGGVMALQDLSEAGILTSSGASTIPAGLVSTATPPKVDSLTATGSFNSILLGWGIAAAGNVAYYEVWRNTSDDLGASVKIGVTRAQMYQDTPPDSSLAVTYYYWVRAVSGSDTLGPWNSTVGTSGSTADEPAYMFELMQDRIGFSEFLPGSFPIRNVASLPTLPHADYPNGCVVALTSDGYKMYRNDAGTWSKDINWSQVVAGGGKPADNATVGMTTGESSQLVIDLQTAVDASPAGNMLNNSDFSAGLDGWLQWDNGIDNPSYGVDLDADSTLVGEHTAWMKNDAPDVSKVMDLYVGWLPVEEGKNYGLGVHVGALRCRAQMLLSFYDSAGEYISGSNNPSFTPAGTGGKRLAEYDRSELAIAAPAGAATAVFIVRKLATSNGETDSYLFVCRPIFCEIPLTATVVPPWSPSRGMTPAEVSQLATDLVSAEANAEAAAAVDATTKANAAKLRSSHTGTQTMSSVSDAGALATKDVVTAALVAANAIIAGKIAAGALVVGDGVMQNAYITEALISNLAVTNAKIGALAVDEGKIAALAVVNAKIAALAVDEGKIANLAVTTGKIADLAVDTLKITGGAVTLPIHSELASSVTLTSRDTWYTLHSFGSVNLHGQSSIVQHATAFNLVLPAICIVGVKVGIFQNGVLKTTVSRSYLSGVSAENMRIIVQEPMVFTPLDGSYSLEIKAQFYRKSGLIYPTSCVVDSGWSIKSGNDLIAGATNAAVFGFKR